ERRFHHMQQHSGEHIVSGMICKAFHCDNVGFHMGDDVVTIDYNVRISYDQALEIEAAANKYIWENHEFVELWPTAEELETIDYRSKKELSGAVRITKFPGADTCACCGTHVKRSGEVGLVKITSAHNFHDGTRMELFCGKRALDFLSMNYRANKDVAVLLSTKEEKTAQMVEKQIADYVQMKAEKAATEDRLFHMWTDSLKGKENILIISDWMNADQGRRLADILSDACNGITAVLTLAGGEIDSYRYAIISKGNDITDFIKNMNQALNGRGGGRNGFAQGTIHAKEEEIRKHFDSFTFA
ncbi:MAG: alanyl-tRNA editing protein, partial [Lachnospiraceae bacterium]|nr:alanyl-tRNA editing protein [Lachnospiraceae bacterium]